MTDTVSLHLTALAAIERTITGVTTAYDAAPDDLSDHSVLPAFINFPLRSTVQWFPRDSESVRGIETRLWAARLYVLPEGASASGDPITLCAPFFDRVRDAFQGQPRLNNTPFVKLATFDGDEGIIWDDLIYAADRFSGIVFRLTIETYVTVNYASGQ